MASTTPPFTPTVTSRGHAEAGWSRADMDESNPAADEEFKEMRQ